MQTESETRIAPPVHRATWRRRLLFPFLLFVIITGFYWKLVLTYQYDWVWGPDVGQQVLPWFDEEARQLQHHRLPLWDPHTWAGQPFLGQAQPGTAYPLNWLLWLTPRRHGHLQMIFLQWYYVLIHYKAALFAYLLCRDLGRSRVASLFAGILFGLAGYVGTTDWPQMLNGAIWTPLVLMFLLRATRGVQPWANAALSGLCVGMAWLSGHHQVPIFLMLCSAGLWIFYFIRSGRLRWRIAGLAAVAMGITVLVGALQILPAREYGKLALRWVGTPEPVGWDQVIPYFVHRDHSLHPITLLGVLFPGLDYNADPFLGVVAISFALLGVALCWREHMVKVFAAIGIAGVIYALGGNSVYQGLIYALVPFIEKARVPAVAVLLFQCSVTVLGAFAIDRFESAAHSVADSIWIRRINIGIAGFAAVTGAVILGVFFSKKFIWDTDDRVMMTVFVAILLTALVYGWRTGNLAPRTACILLLMLLILELGNDAGYMLADRNDNGRRNFIDKIWSNGDIAAFLHDKHTGPFRVESTTEEIFKNWGDYNDLDFLQTQAGVTANTFQIEGHLWSNRMLFGVRYTLGRAPVDPSQISVFEGKSGVQVFENPGAFPRAWAVREVITVRGVNEGRQMINEHLAELRYKAFTKGTAPTLPACDGDTGAVDVVKYTPDVVDLRANMRCDGMVVLSDVYYPGWDATVDGKPAEIHEVNFTMRGVLVPKGAHDLRYKYRPGSVYAGAGLTLSGCLLTLGICLWGRKRSTA